MLITFTVADDDGDGFGVGVESESFVGDRDGVGDGVLDEAGVRVGSGEGVLDDAGVGVVVGLGQYEGVADMLYEALGVGVILRLGVDLLITSIVAADDDDGLGVGFGLGLECEFFTGHRVGFGEGVLDDADVGVVIGLRLYEGVANMLGETVGVDVMLGIGVVLCVGETDGVGVTVKSNRPISSRSFNGVKTSSPASSFAAIVKSFVFSDSFSAFLRCFGDSIEPTSNSNPWDKPTSNNGTKAHAE